VEEAGAGGFYLSLFSCSCPWNLGLLTLSVDVVEEGVNYDDRGRGKGGGD